MAEPEDIVEEIRGLFSKKKTVAPSRGKKS
jgi:hypothetical protein